VSDTQLAQVSSPLKIRWRDKHFVAENSSGGIVFDGTAAGDDLLALTTANGTWRIQKRTSDESGKHNRVLDGGGQEVARLDRRVVRSTLINLPGGEAIPVTKGRFMLFAHGSRMGSLAVSQTPFLMPGRYFTMKLTDELLARPDRELLLVLGAYIASIAISASIQASVQSGG
jgi:hypothetical protein